LKGMFDPSSAEVKNDPEFYKELKKDIREEVEKIGPIEVLTVFENNPQGVVAIKFQEPEDAEACIKKMDGRWFDKRQIHAEWYDGVSNYKVAEKEDDIQKRLDDFGDWLENQSSSEEEEPVGPLED
jgi:HIV Tat-specific factor 1